MKWTRILKRGEHFVRHVDDLTPWDIQKNYPDCRVVNVQTTEYPELNEDEKAMIAHYAGQADKKTIKSYLVKLSGHKRIAGDENQVKFTLREAVNLCKTASELQIYNAYYHFAFEDESDFFPNPARLKNKVFGKTI